MPVSPRYHGIALARQPIAFSLLLATLISAHADSAPSVGERAIPVIGYTESRNDLEGGQFVNWRTNRACVVRSDGTGRKALAGGLTSKEGSWTQFAGWSPDGQRAIVLSLWQSPENAATEREQRTFRMTEGWLADTCLVEMATGTVNNLTSTDRVSIHNTGLCFLRDDSGFGFAPLTDGVSRPFVMDLDGLNERDVSGGGRGFAFGCFASPDGTWISCHENDQLFISNADGSDKRRIGTGNPFNLAPRWSPDGRWLMFVSSEHYDCHPHHVRKDGTGLRKLADRGGYRGVVERLKRPDFHSESSDLPVWSPESRSLFFTAKLDDRVELLRVDLDGHATRLTTSSPGTRHDHPAVSPVGRPILFGSDRGGTMQLHVATIDGMETRPMTHLPPGHCAMHGHRQPTVKSPAPSTAPPSKSSCDPEGSRDTNIIRVGKGSWNER